MKKTLVYILILSIGFIFGFMGFERITDSISQNIKSHGLMKRAEKLSELVKKTRIIKQDSFN